MKKMNIFLLAAVALCLTACTSDDDAGVELFDVSISLSKTIQDAEVTMKGASTYTQKTDEQGVARFAVPAGNYEVSTTGHIAQDGRRVNYNAVIGQMSVGQHQANAATLDIKESEGEAVIIIKEVYNGGVMLDDGSKNFMYDKCIILYNNSDMACTTENLCFGFAPQYNAEANNQSNMYDNGKLVFEDEKFVPALMGIWYFQQPLTIEPYSQVVVNVHGAIDNTLTVSNSVNYANSDYYCMYDPDYVTADVASQSAVSFNNTSYYPAPAEVIPTSHYLKTIKYGQGNAWSLSTTSPALFIFQTKGTTPKAWFEDTANYWYSPGSATTPVFRSVKVPYEWVIDGVEVFNKAKLSACQKRFPADIDAGSVALTNQLGHTLYRNVDKQATEGLPENEGKLVYHYALGVDNSTDPSGIDAEASIKNGAHIVYQDTNNSTNDFHERSSCSLRN